MELDLAGLLKPYLTLAGVIVAGIGLILLIAPNSFKKLEEVLNEEVGGIRKKVFPFLENSIVSFNAWLFKKPNAVAVICIIVGAIFFVISKKL